MDMTNTDRPKLFCYRCSIRVAHSDCDVTRHLEDDEVDSWLIPWSEA